MLTSEGGAIRAVVNISPVLTASSLPNATTSARLACPSSASKALSASSETRLSLQWPLLRAVMPESIEAPTKTGKLKGLVHHRSVRSLGDQLANLIGAVLSITTILYSILRVPEIVLPTEERAKLAARPSGAWVTVAEIAGAIRSMPDAMAGTRVRETIRLASSA